MKLAISRARRELPSYAVLAALIAVGVLYCLLTGAIGAKEIGAGLFALIGTYIGAFLAFRLQLLKDATAEESARVDELNRALLVMCLQFNHLLQWKATLEKYTTPFERMINMPAESDAAFDSRQTVERLAFLIATPHAGLILTVALEQSRFDACREVIAERCRLMVDEVQPAIERHQLNGRPSTEAGIEQAFGERLFGALRTQTAQLYLHIPSTVDSLEATLIALHTAAKSLYPRHPFMLMERPNDTRPSHDAQ